MCLPYSYRAPSGIQPRPRTCQLPRSDPLLIRVTKQKGLGGLAVLTSGWPVVYRRTIPTTLWIWTAPPGQTRQKHLGMQPRHLQT